MVPARPISLTIAPRLHQSLASGLTLSATHLCCSTLVLLGEELFLPPNIKVGNPN